MTSIGQVVGLAADKLNGLFQSIGLNNSVDTETGLPSSHVIFTSTLRQIFRLESLTGDLSQLDTFRAIRDRVLDSALLNNATISTRTAFDQRLQRAITALQSRADSRMTEIVMALNPTSVRFAQAKRFTAINTFAGTTYMHFSDRRGFNNDVLTLAMSGTSGNIDLRGFQTGDVAAAMQNLRKLLCWLNLYWLTLEEKSLPEFGLDNKVTITYTSKAFPQTFDFIGFFDKVMSFEETGAEQFSINYELSFIVEKTDPPFDELFNLASTLVQQAGRAATGVGSISPEALSRV